MAAAPAPYYVPLQGPVPGPGPGAAPVYAVPDYAAAAAAAAAGTGAVGTVAVGGPPPVMPGATGVGGVPPFGPATIGPQYDEFGNIVDDDYRMVRARFDAFCTKYEVDPRVVRKLWSLFFRKTKIVVLCDDSGSMNTRIREPGAPDALTRWLELKQLVVRLIELSLAVGQALDIYFLNRRPLKQVTSMDGLQAVFSKLPSGSTPLGSRLSEIYQDNASLPADMSLLVLILTDGEPDNRREFYLALVNKAPNVHVSIAALTDDEEDMAYLDQNGKIRNYDDTDDYRTEMRKVKALQGPQFKFDYTDYVLKIVLATYDRWFFNLDMQGGAGGLNAPLLGGYGGSGGGGGGCCECSLL